MLYYSREDTDTTTRSMSAEIPCISCTVACKTFFDMCELTKGISDDSSYHYSQIRGLRSMKCSSAMLQNLRYFMYTKTNIPFVYSYFIVCNFTFYLWICTLVLTFTREKVKLQAMKYEKKFILIFMYTKRITNFEVFHWNITLSARLLFLMTHMVKLSLMHFIK